MMGDLITVFVKSPGIPAQGVLGDYIDRCIMTVKKHDVVKYPHMRQLRLAPQRALHVTSIMMCIAVASSPTLYPLFNVARRKEGRSGTRNHVTEREGLGERRSMAPRRSEVNRFWNVTAHNRREVRLYR